MRWVCSHVRGGRLQVSELAEVLSELKAAGPPQPAASPAAASSSIELQNEVEELREAMDRNESVLESVKEEFDSFEEMICQVTSTKLI